VPTDVDYVLNLAIAKTTSWDADLAANVEGLGLLMSRLRNAKALLHCSSTAVYQANDHHVFVETDPLGDNHRVPAMETFMPTYSINKIAAEAMARYVAREHGIRDRHGQASGLRIGDGIGHGRRQGQGIRVEPGGGERHRVGLGDGRGFRDGLGDGRGCRIGDACGLREQRGIWQSELGGEASRRAFTALTPRLPRRSNFTLARVARPRRSMRSSSRSGSCSGTILTRPERVSR